MMTILTYLLYAGGIYVLGILASAAWNAYIGFSDDKKWEELNHYSLMEWNAWPFLLPWITYDKVNKKLIKIRNKRLKKKEQEKRIRVEAAQEEKRILIEMDREEEYERLRENDPQEQTKELLRSWFGKR